MPHSYPNVLVHCVFSTLGRQSTIPGNLRPRLWKYFAGIGMNHGISILASGGTSNHAHLLIVLPADVALSKAVQLLKANSSRWIGEHGIEFAWQEGYAAFSVSESQRSLVQQYIADQERHHRKRDFEEEYRALLAKSGVSYDPKYVFG